MSKEKTPQIRPMHDYVLVRREKAEKVSTGGIIIPEEAQAKADRGTVISTGPGRIDDRGRRHEPEVKKGDVVLLPKYAGAEDMRGSLPSQHLLIRESEILAVEEG